MLFADTISNPMTGCFTWFLLWTFFGGFTFSLSFAKDGHLFQALGYFMAGPLGLVLYFVPKATKRKTHQNPVEAVQQMKGILAQNYCIHCRAPIDPETFICAECEKNAHEIVVRQESENGS